MHTNGWGSSFHSALAVLLIFLYENCTKLFRYRKNYYNTINNNLKREIQEFLFLTEEL